MRSKNEQHGTTAEKPKTQNHGGRRWGIKNVKGAGLPSSANRGKAAGKTESWGGDTLAGGAHCEEKSWKQRLRREINPRRDLAAEGEVEVEKGVELSRLRAKNRERENC